MAKKGSRSKGKAKKNDVLNAMLSTAAQSGGTRSVATRAAEVSSDAAQSTLTEDWTGKVWASWLGTTSNSEDRNYALKIGVKAEGKHFKIALMSKDDDARAIEKAEHPFTSLFTNVGEEAKDVLGGKNPKPFVVGPFTTNGELTLRNFGVAPCELLLLIVFDRDVDTKLHVSVKIEH